MIRELLFTSILCFSLLAGALSQSPYHEMAKDTIITRPLFFGNAYLLDGKRLNIQVMQWFMTDHPLAHDQIRVSVVSGQMAGVGYTVGGMIFLGGLLVGQDDRAAGEDLMLMGGVGIGAGLLLSIISGGHQRRAVQLYNEDIKRYFNSSAGMEWHIGFSGNGLTLRFM
ncbi:MAG: hypothetical protein H6573_33140 [Lewinellaceae bacterium]|nr:hypothetical protein [Phaeodactylibacter sp.]MCB9352302.1 hypothetical protein [Lewinellaceae bacterium]